MPPLWSAFQRCNFPICPVNDRQKWTLEDYQREIMLCRKSAANHRKAADRYDAAAEELRKEAAKFSTEKLPLFGEKK